MTSEERAREVAVGYGSVLASSDAESLAQDIADAIDAAVKAERDQAHMIAMNTPRDAVGMHSGELLRDLAHRIAENIMAGVIRSRGPAPERPVIAGANHVPGERSTAEYSPLAIAVARDDGRLRVDSDGLGWIHDMEPDAPRGSNGK